MKVPTNLLKDAINFYLRELKPLYGEDEARQLIYILTDFYFGINRLKLTLEPIFRMSESEMLRLHFAVKDLKRYKPVQYITGRAWFCDNWFKVSSEVLIPRPETEELTRLAIEGVKTTQRIPRILDIGTGSGCIAVSIKLALPHAEVFAFDISENALEVAKSNANQLGAVVNFLIADVINYGDEFEEGFFDLIVSNPPYVTQSDKQSLKPNVVEWEPSQALFVEDDDPLLYYRHIGLLAKRLLSNNGMMVVEINENLARQLNDLFKKQAYQHISLLQDIHGKTRFVKAMVSK